MHSHEYLTHWITVTILTFFKLPDFVNCTSSAAIHSLHNFLHLPFNGLWTQTSKGWTNNVIPPGITATSVLEISLSTSSVMWARNESNTNKAFFFRRRVNFQSRGWGYTRVSHFWKIFSWKVGGLAYTRVGLYTIIYGTIKTFKALINIFKFHVSLFTIVNKKHLLCINETDSLFFFNPKL